MFRYRNPRYAPPARPRTSHRPYFEPTPEASPVSTCVADTDIAETPASGAGLRARLLAMITARIAPRTTPENARQEQRDDKLRRLVARLQDILAELDELGVWRVGINVCEAIDRIGLELADSGGTSKVPRFRGD